MNDLPAHVFLPLSLSPVGSSLSSVTPYMHEQLYPLQAPPPPPPSHPQPTMGCHLSRQDTAASSFFLHDDAFATTMGAASGFSGFRKSYLPAGFMWKSCRLWSVLMTSRLLRREIIVAKGKDLCSIWDCLDPSLCEYSVHNLRLPDLILQQPLNLLHSPLSVRVCLWFFFPLFAS